MHIAHIQGIFSPEHGGPTQSLINYCQHQVRAGNKLSVWTLEGLPNTSAAIRLPKPIETHVCPVDSPARLGGSIVMRHALREADSPDLYHLHGAWLRAMHYGAEEARKRKRPYMLELMGMYEPWGLCQKWLQKRIARWWFQDEILKQANCLHVNSNQEAEHLRRLGFKAPIAVIPVGVDLQQIERQKSDFSISEFQNLSVSESQRFSISERDVSISASQCVSISEFQLSAFKNRPFVLFLSRIHEKKGIDLLLQAWAKLRTSHLTSTDWLLLIAGSGEPDYVQRCQAHVARLGLNGSCIWAGRLSEEEKSWAYSNASLFVLPSYSENYGNAIAEALAHGTPVITTTKTPWHDLVQKNCGWIVEPAAEDLAEKLDAALKLGPAQLRALGRNGIQWCRSEFSLDFVAREIESVYEWLLGGKKPKCVI
jgi:glycosyltransferase involved in cell wall biosynthesis